MLKTCPASIFALVFTWVAALALPLLADDGNGSAIGSIMNSDSILFSRPVLSVSQEITRVVRGGEYINTGGNLNDDWFMPTNGSVDFRAKKNERLGLEVMLTMTYFAAPYQYDLPQNYVRNISVTAPKLDISYVFGNLDHPFLKVDVGNFVYKYNDNSRNLGEYMFRTWAYPGIIETGSSYGYLGYSNANLTGIKLSQSFGMFSQDFLATIETEFTPVYDLNLTYMAKFNYHNIFKVGCGVQLARILSSDFTSPNLSSLTVDYFQENGVQYVAGNPGLNYYTDLQAGIDSMLRVKGTTSADSARLNKQLGQDTLALKVLDSLNSGLINPKMQHFNAQAIKPDIYFSFDPKPLFRSQVFGPNDWVIYGEASVLGTEDHPVFYTDIWKRIPVMMGFNVPTCKVLDVLSLEVEYYGSQWMPTYPSPSGPNYDAVPAPFLDRPYYPTFWDKDNWKWSVYAERSLISGLTISGQVASDHSRTWDWDTFGKTPWELYTTPSQWYWGIKLNARI